jgi:hypothetical protein
MGIHTTGFRHISLDKPLLGEAFFSTVEMEKFALSLVVLERTTLVTNTQNYHLII